MRAIRRFTVRTVLPESLSGLSELAANLRWSWHSATQDLFARVDPALWHAEGDPLRLLGAVPASRWAELEADGDFRSHLARVHADLHDYLAGDR